MMKLHTLQATELPSRAATSRRRQASWHQRAGRQLRFPELGLAPSPPASEIQILRVPFPGNGQAGGAERGRSGAREDASWAAPAPGQPARPCQWAAVGPLPRASGQEGKYSAGETSVSVREGIRLISEDSGTMRPRVRLMEQQPGICGCATTLCMKVTGLGAAQAWAAEQAGQNAPPSPWPSRNAFPRGNRRGRTCPIHPRVVPFCQH